MNINSDKFLYIFLAIVGSIFGIILSCAIGAKLGLSAGFFCGWMLLAFYLSLYLIARVAGNPGYTDATNLLTRILINDLFARSGFVFIILVVMGSAAALWHLGEWVLGKI